jgi:DNA mismatch repair protein MutS
VALAEQVSEAGRGLIQRAVTRVLTPGTVAEPALLPAGENRYLAAVLPLGGRVGLAWVDVSTGEFAVTELTGPKASCLLAEELARLSPSECLVPEEAMPQVPLPGRLTRLETWHFEPERARASLCERFQVRSLAPYGCEELPAATGAAGAILAYLSRTNPALLPLLSGVRTESTVHQVGLDAATRRNLELVRSLKTGGTRGSLLGVLDETRTAMGARTLRRLLSQPLRELTELQRRQGIVAALVADPSARAALGGELGGVGDLERLTGRVTQGLGTARDMLALGAALRCAGRLWTRLDAHPSPALRQLAHQVDGCADVLALLDSAVVEEGEGARIREGFSLALDAAQEEVQQTRRWLAALEKRERERTGIKSLKVGHNKVFGYYLEVTRPNLSLVPGDYMRKQTVASGERFFTAPLKEAEARILGAEEHIVRLEREALGRVTAELTRHAPRLLATAAHLAQLDALLALAEVAARFGWVAPHLEESEELVITQGRHPVVESHLGGEPFIPNDCTLRREGPRLLLVSGPNMGGKSTYLRQVALITLLAQVGSFVPAREARVGLVDRIFSRVGAQDDLAGGASTFMVEMLETATILHQATPRSLVILDEVGRGTSTHDGLAIARAVLEDLHGRVGARTLFATHYLELAALSEHLPGVENVHVAAMESDGRVVFLYAVRPGPASRSYGIQVARLAGLPPWVAARAETLLAERTAAPAPEAQRQGPRRQAAFPAVGTRRGADERIARALRRLDLERLTPREALNWLFEQQAALPEPS